MPVDASVSGFDFAFLNDLLDHLAHPTLLELRGIEQGVRKGFATNFSNQGSAGRPWASLAVWTQRERRWRGFNPTSPILIRSGRYQRSWTRVGGFTELAFLGGGAGWVFGVGSNDPRAEALDYGFRGRNLPARPVRLLDFAAERGVASALEAWVDSVLLMFI